MGKRGPHPVKGKKYKKMHTCECKVCKSGKREEIERGYINWITQKELAETYGVPANSISNHVSYFGLKKKRAKNYIKLLDRMIEQAQIGLVPEKYKPSDLKDCIALKAKLEGDLVDRQQVNVFGALASLSVDQIRELLAKLGCKLRSTEV